MLPLPILEVDIHNRYYNLLKPEVLNMLELPAVV